MEFENIPQEILKSKTKDIEKIDKKVLELIEKLWHELKNSKRPGVGLAAPQIGEPYNITVIGYDPTEEDLKKSNKNEKVPWTVLINPKITWRSKEMFLEKEGCLSVDEKIVDVPRYQKVHVEFMDETGKRRKIKAKGYLSRVLQHEIDHLQGKIITDYENQKL